MEVFIAFAGVGVGALLGWVGTEWHEGRRRRRLAVDALQRLISSLSMLEVGIASVSALGGISEVSWASSVFKIPRIREELHNSFELVTADEIRIVQAAIDHLELMSALNPDWQPMRPDATDVGVARRLIATRLWIEQSRDVRSRWPWSQLRKEEEALDASVKAALAELESGGLPASPVREPL
jgi:hypothetical protein